MEVEILVNLEGFIMIVTEVNMHTGNLLEITTDEICSELDLFLRENSNIVTGNLFLEEGIDSVDTEEISILLDIPVHLTILNSEDLEQKISDML